MELYQTFHSFLKSLIQSCKRQFSLSSRVLQITVPDILVHSSVAYTELYRTVKHFLQGLIHDSHFSTFPEDLKWNCTRRLFPSSMVLKITVINIQTPSSRVLHETVPNSSALLPGSYIYLYHIFQSLPPGLTQNSTRQLSPSSSVLLITVQDISAPLYKVLHRTVPDSSAPFFSVLHGTLPYHSHLPPRSYRKIY